MNTRPQFTSTGTGLLVRAPAKINLSLLIAGKRPDGYHEVETLMAKVDVYDEIRIEPGVLPGVDLRCEGPQWAPDGPDNLVFRAARLLLDASGVQADIRITLTKNVPAGSGLGSASSDAAATLLGVARFLHLDVPGDQLMDLAGRLGSDTAFFLNGPLALCTGRGERVLPVVPSYDFLALLVLPGIHVSTARVYAQYEHDPDLYRTAHDRIAALLSQDRLDRIARLGMNMLAPTCFRLECDLARLKHGMEALGVGPMCLKGSGSALYKILGRGDEAQAREAQEKLMAHVHCPVWIVGNNRW